jgi:hypothetical protein
MIPYVLYDTGEIRGVEKPEGKKPLERRGRKCEDNIKMGLTHDSGYKGVD